MQNLMPEISTPDKRFHDGNPLTGEDGTIVPALWLNNVQQAVRNAQLEIISTLKAAGVDINTDKNDQLVAAINQLIVSKFNNASLTGIPTAPTAATGTNSTQLANTAFVKASIAALVGSSPDALDTLNELAAALDNDPNFATTVLNKLAEKLDKAQNGADIPNKEAFRQNLQIAGWEYGRLLNVQTFSASGTYTPTTGTKKIIVEIVGGGGGGGGAAAPLAGQASIGGGGSSGAYAKCLIYNPPQNVSISIGAGGGRRCWFSWSVWGCRWSIKFRSIRCRQRRKWRGYNGINTTIIWCRSLCCGAIHHGHRWSIYSREYRL